MKYWFFDGNDVVGPFEPKELTARPGFAATSLVCPENYSDDQDSWKLAGSFEDFHFDAKDLPPIERPEPEVSQDAFDEEMDTLLKERSPLGNLDESPVEAPSLEVPKKPAKPGPIEDYFNNIKGEDLGDILGIPDPNENSDMNLARALQKQFNKTAPPPDKDFQPIENDPFDEFTSNEDTEEEEELPFPQEESLPEKELPREKPLTAPAPPAPKSVLQQPEAAPKKNAEKAKKEEPTSIPMSQSSEEELVLTVHGQPPLQESAPKEVPAEEPAQPEPEKPADAPAAEPAKEPAEEKPSETPEQTATEESPEKETPEEQPAEEEEAPTFQLPILGQQETQIPPVPEQEPVFEPQPEEKEPQQTPVPPETPAEPSAQEPLPQAEAAPQAEPTAEEPAPSAQPISEPDTLEEKQPAVDQAPENDQPEELVPSPEPQNSKEGAVEQILEGKLEVELAPEIPEPIKNVPVETKVNQVRTHLKQTPEIKEFLTQTQNERAEREKSHKKAMAALSVLVALLAVGAAVYINQTLLNPQPAAQTESMPFPQETAPVQDAVPMAPPQEENDAKELLPDIPVPPPPAIPGPSLEEKALSAVQNYRLPGNRGTIAAYLEKLYRTQKAQGYTSAWSVEPLHKNTYIVKYRLTKTRMEPIVYVFQADAEQGKLTGALNNITLDLVGKIQ